MGANSLLRMLPVLLLAAACGDAAAPATSAAPRVDQVASTTEATVTCEDNEVSVAEPSVATQADGVHLTIDNRDGGQRIVWARSAGRQQTEAALPGASSVVISWLPPGEWALLCSPASVYPGDDAAGTTLAVVDPAGHWVDDALGCEHPTHTHPDYEEYFTGGTPTGEQGDPLAMAEEEASSWFPVRPSDAIEPAGYPDAAPRRFRVMRRGSAVALVSYSSDGQGGWYFGSVEYCE